MDLFVDFVNNDKSIEDTITYYKEMGIQLAYETICRPCQ
jgi:hypothetical protein